MEQRHDHQAASFNPLKSGLSKKHKIFEMRRLLPYGRVRDAALTKARQIEAAAHMDDWSSGLRPLKKDDTSGPN
jgi:hypothetical protein